MDRFSMKSSEPKIPHQYLPGSFSLRPWRELSGISALFVELSWVTLWYRVLIASGKEVSYLQAFFALSGLLLLFYISNRLMAFLNIHILVRRFLLLLLLLFNLTVGMRWLLYSREAIELTELINRPVRTFQDMANIIPAEFVVMVLILLVSWRGLAYSDQTIGPYQATASFRLGIIMFFLYGLILPITDESPNRALYLFLFFSLLSMTAARIAVLSQLRGGHRIQFNRQWLLGILLVIFGLIGISTLVIDFANEQMFSLLYTIYTWTIYLLVLIFSPLLFGLARFLIWLFGWIRLQDILDFLVQALKNIQNMISLLVNTITHLTERLNLGGIGRLFDFLVRLKPLYLWAGLILIVIVILYGVRKQMMKNERSLEQDGSALPMEDDLLHLLRSALRRGLDRMAENIEDLLGLRQARRLLAAARVRRIYAQLLVMSAQLDQPRPASKTPLEFMPQLERLFPGFNPELKTITDAYLLVRYGETPETPDELAQVETAWRLISTVGKAKIREKRHLQHAH